MQSTIHNIPENWKFVHLDEIGIVVSGGTPATDITEYWSGDIPWITPADLSSHTDVYISKGKRNISQLGLQSSSATLIPENSVLFSTRAPIGYVAIAKTRLATNQGFKNIVLYPKIDSKYVYYYLQSIRELAINNASGTTFLELSGSKFKELPFPFAPIEEQKRISTKIDELFSDIDKNNEILKEAINQIEITKAKFLQRYFQAHLPHQRQLGTLCHSISYGYTAKSYKNPKKNSSKYLRITDIQDENINWDAVPYCDSTPEVELKYSIDKDDILFARSGNTVGKTILISSDEKSLFASYLIRIRIKKELLNAKYLSFFLKSHFYWNQINAGLTGIGQPNFNGSKVAKLHLPVPDIQIQNDVADTLESTFIELNRLAAEIHGNLTAADHLKNKILQDAFSGNLSSKIEADSEVADTLAEIVDFKKNTQLLERNRAKQVRIVNDYNVLLKIIKEKYGEGEFSYADLFSSSRMSKKLFKAEFEVLESRKLVTRKFDKKSETIKFKLQ